MAIIKMGAIVTEIKGKLGGHVFKSQRGTKVLMLKSNGYSRDKQLRNPAIGFAAWVFQMWIHISEECRLAWSNEAAILLFPDKFGQQRHISGRELFTKTNINLGYGYFTECLPAGFSSFTPLISMQQFKVIKDPDSSTVVFYVESPSTVFIDFTAEVAASHLPAVTFGTRLLLLRVPVTTSANVDLTAVLFARFPFLAIGYHVRLYATVVNIYGFKGATIHTSTVVTSVPAVWFIAHPVISYNLSTATIVITPPDAAVYTYKFAVEWWSLTAPPIDFGAQVFSKTITQSGDAPMDIKHPIWYGTLTPAMWDQVRVYVRVFDSNNIMLDEQYVQGSVQDPAATITLTQVTGSLDNAVVNIGVNLSLQKQTEFYMMVQDSVNPLPAYDPNDFLSSWSRVIVSSGVYPDTTIFGQFSGSIDYDSYCRLIIRHILPNGVWLEERIKDFMMEE